MSRVVCWIVAGFILALAATACRSASIPATTLPVAGGQRVFIFFFTDG